jgi:hypothetical protein
MDRPERQAQLPLTRGYSQKRLPRKFRNVSTSMPFAPVVHPIRQCIPLKARSPATAMCTLLRLPPACSSYFIRMHGPLISSQLLR